MLTMAVPWRAAEDRNHYLRAEPPNNAHDVLEDGVPGPVRPGVAQVLGEAEVVRAGEELLAPVEATRRAQLLGPEEPQRFTKFVADEILPALSPVEGEIPGLGPHPAHEHREQFGVLVIGVGGDHQYALLVSQEAEGAIQRGVSTGRRRLELSRQRKRGKGEDKQGEEEAEAWHAVKLIPDPPVGKTSGRLPGPRHLL